MNKTYDWLFVLPMDGAHGGAEQLILNLTNYLITKGNRCCVIFIRKKRFGDWEHLEDKCDIHYFSQSNVYLGFLLLLPKLLKISKKYKVKNTFTSQTLVNGMIGLSRCFGCFKTTKVIVRESNTIFDLLNGPKLRMYAFAYQLGYRKVDLVICQTNFMKEQLLNALPWMRNKLNIIVLSNPINMDMVLEKSKKPVKKLISKDYIVAAGRLVPAKGFDILINAFHLVAKDYPELSLLILGEGPEREKLNEISASYDLSEKVLLPGIVENVFPYFRDATACVLSSRIEGFPNVLLQMMSQNTKVVSTLSAGGIDEIEGIFTCETENPRQLAEAIKKCLVTDTAKNRIYFDENLEQRTFEKFLYNITNMVSSSN